MNKSMSRKIVCVLLALVMVVCIPLSASAASAKDTPVVVINGIQNNNLYNFPNAGLEVSNRADLVWPPEQNELIEYAKMITEYVLMGEGYYDEVTNTIFPEVCEMFVNLICNNDGTVRDNLGPKKMYYSLDHYKKDAALLEEMAGDLGLAVAEASGYDNVYVFAYDWRLSPIDLAKELNTFIEEYVKPQTGADKVTILSEGMGGNVASAYLDMFQKDKDFSGIQNYVTINSTAQGNTLGGALYTGQIDVDPNGVVRWLDDWSDFLPTAFASWLVNYIMNTEYELYHAVGCVDTYLVHALPDIYDLYVRNIIKNTAGLWALVPWTDDDAVYYAALEFMYPEEGQPINSVLKEKLDKYHEIQRTAGDVLQAAKANDVGVAVVSSYALQYWPIVDGLDYQKSASETSDGYTDTKYSSFGATCAYLNTEWVGYQVDIQQIDDGHNHLNIQYNSPAMFQGSIDASTCALPENTWFIYGLKNDYLHTENNDAYYFVNALAFMDKDFDVWTNPYYPQFMQYNRFTDKLYVYHTDDIDRYLTLAGDTNLDGKVTAADARLALRHSAGLEELTRIALKNGDVNGKTDDGKNGVSAADARLILRYCAGLENALVLSSEQNTQEKSTADSGSIIDKIKNLF